MYGKSGANRQRQTTPFHSSDFVATRSESSSEAKEELIRTSHTSSSFPRNPNVNTSFSLDRGHDSLAQDLPLYLFNRYYESQEYLNRKKSPNRLIASSSPSSRPFSPPPTDYSDIASSSDHSASTYQSRESTPFSYKSSGTIDSNHQRSNRFNDSFLKYLKTDFDKDYHSQTSRVLNKYLDSKQEKESPANKYLRSLSSRHLPRESTVQRNSSSPAINTIKSVFEDKPNNYSKVTPLKYHWINEEGESPLHKRQTERNFNKEQSPQKLTKKSFFPIDKQEKKQKIELTWENLVKEIGDGKHMNEMWSLDQSICMEVKAGEKIEIVCEGLKFDIVITKDDLNQVKRSDLPVVKKESEQDKVINKFVKDENIQTDEIIKVNQICEVNLSKQRNEVKTQTSFDLDKYQLQPKDENCNYFKKIEQQQIEKEEVKSHQPNEIETSSIETVDEQQSSVEPEDQIQSYAENKEETRNETVSSYERRPNELSDEGTKLKPREENETKKVDELRNGEETKGSETYYKQRPTDEPESSKVTDEETSKDYSSEKQVEEKEEKKVELESVPVKPERKKLKDIKQLSEELVEMAFNYYKHINRSLDNEQQEEKQIEKREEKFETKPKKVTSEECDASFSYYKGFGEDFVQEKLLENVPEFESKYSSIEPVESDPSFNYYKGLNLEDVAENKTEIKQEELKVKRKKSVTFAASTASLNDDKSFSYYKQIVNGNEQPTNEPKNEQKYEQPTMKPMFTDLVAESCTETFNYYKGTTTNTQQQQRQEPKVETVPIEYSNVDNYYKAKNMEPILYQSYSSPSSSSSSVQETQEKKNVSESYDMKTIVALIIIAIISLLMSMYSRSSKPPLKPKPKVDSTSCNVVKPIWLRKFVDKRK